MKEKKKISTRETLLFAVLGILVLGLCYYKFFYMHIQGQIATLEADRDFEQSQITTLNSRVALVNSMRDSVDASKSEVLADPLPEYDNGKSVIKELNRILAATDTYSLNFAAITHNDYIAERPVQITFKSPSYKAARTIISKLNSSEYFNQISDVSMNVEKGSYDEDGNYNASCSVSLTITYFEVDG